MAGPRKWELFPAIETAVADHRAVDAHHPPFPVFVATVDNPAYRARYAKTACHLQSQGFTPFPVQMLDAEKDSGSRRKVVYQGWQRVLVPYLMACVDLESGEAAGNRSTKHTAGFSRAMSEKSNFLVVMEDDVRVTVHASELWIEVGFLTAKQTQTTLLWLLEMKEQTHEASHDK